MGLRVIQIFAYLSEKYVMAFKTVKMLLMRDIAVSNTWLADAAF